VALQAPRDESLGPDALLRRTHTAPTVIYPLSLHDALPISAEQLGTQLRPGIRGLPEKVHPAQNAILDVARYGGHGVRFVHHRQVVGDAFAVFVHAANTVLNDDRDFISKRGIVGPKVGNG